jgi:hypothetical protein
MPIAKIEREHVATGLAKIKTDHGPVSVIRARVALTGFFSWAMGEGIAKSNPVVGTNKGAEPAARDCVLSDSSGRRAAMTITAASSNCWH